MQFEGSLAALLSHHAGGLADGAGGFGFHCTSTLYTKRLLFVKWQGRFVQLLVLNSTFVALGTNRE